MKILTIGEILYTQDKRFSPIHNEGSNVWILKLTDPQLKDSGEYECQVSYHDDKEERLKMPFSLVVLGKLQLLFEIISLVFTPCQTRTLQYEAFGKNIHLTEIK